jgi:hypothetical protein
MYTWLQKKSYGPGFGNYMVVKPVDDSPMGSETRVVLSHLENVRDFRRDWIVTPPNDELKTILPSPFVLHYMFPTFVFHE